MSDSDYEERKQGQQRSAAAPQISYIPPLPVPDQAAIQLDLQQRTLERYQQFFATPAVAQRSSAAPVLEAAQVQRTLVLQRQQSQLALQRQIAELEHDLPRDALQAALQRQAEQAGVPALPPIFSGPTRSQPSYADHAQRYAHEAVSLQRQADQHSGFVSMSAWPTIQQRAAQDLAQRFRSDTSPTIQRYAELGQSLALVQRQPQGKHVAQVVLQRLPAGERPSVQRALDEAEQEHQQFQAQDQKALELHALQRKLTEEDALAPQAIPRGSGQPLPLAVQRQLEVGLNIPREHLQTVRVHADPAAHSFAKSVQAIAATTGTNIFFQQGKLDTESAEGQELLAHEVTHTYQQAQGKVTGKGIDPDPALEQEARDAGKRFTQSVSHDTTLGAWKTDDAAVQVGRSAPPITALQRQVAPPTSPFDLLHVPLWTRVFSGTLAGKAIEATLSRTNQNIDGAYSYGKGQLTLSGSIDAQGKLNLLEYDGDHLSGRLSGTLSPDGVTLALTWTPSAESVHPHAYQGALHLIDAAGRPVPGRAPKPQTASKAPPQPKLGPVPMPPGRNPPAQQPSGPQLQPVISQVFVQTAQQAVLDATRRLDANQAPSKANVEVYVPKIIAEAVREGVINPAEIAVMLANASHESGLHPKTEGMYYTAERAHLVFPGRFPTVASAEPYARNPERFGNHVYANKLGNGNEASGDGYRFRGRGLVQITGRSHYAEWTKRLSSTVQDDQGHPINFTDDPDAMNRPDIAVRALVQGVSQGLYTKAGSLEDFLQGKRLNASTFTDARLHYVGPFDTAVVGRVTAAIYEKLKNIPVMEPHEEKP